MSTGRFIAVVGESGVGKDSVLTGLLAARPDMHLVRRLITRDADAGGEVFDAVSETGFADMVDAGAFALHWSAHDLQYGIPESELAQLQNGIDCLANLSRGSLREAAELFPSLVVLNITAQPHTLARRLAERGRESEAEIAKRLARSDKPLPEGLEVIHLANDGPLSQTISRALSALDRARDASPQQATQNDRCLT